MERITVIQDGSLRLQRPLRTMRQMAHDSEVGYRRWHALTSEQLETYRTAPPSAWQIFASDVRETALSLRWNPQYTAARYEARQRQALASLACEAISRIADLAGMKPVRYDAVPYGARMAIFVADAGEESQVTASLAAARRAARQTAIDRVKVIAPSLDSLAREPQEWIGVASKIGARRSRLHVQEARRNAGQIWRLGDTPINAIGVVNEAISMSDRQLGYGKVSA